MENDECNLNLHVKTSRVIDQNTDIINWMHGSSSELWDRMQSYHSKTDMSIDHIYGSDLGLSLTYSMDP